MKTLIIAAIAAAALSSASVNAQAQDETDRALGAGSYLNPNGPSQGAWAAGSAGISNVGAVHVRKSR